MTAIFTTLRARNGQAWFLDDHCRRLDVDLADSILRSIRAGAYDDARVRVTVSADAEPRIEVEAYTPPETPWRLRPVVVSPSEDRARLKTTDRAMYEKARKAAADADDALLSLPDKTLLETTIANVFFLFGKRLVTPHADEPLLPGIARKRVLAAATALGLTPEEARIGSEEVRDADACVVTNALMIAHPVRVIEGVGTYESVELARRLRDVVVPDSPQSV